MKSSPIRIGPAFRTSPCRAVGRTMPRIIILIPERPVNSSPLSDDVDLELLFQLVNGHDYYQEVPKRHQHEEIRQLHWYYSITHTCYMILQSEI